MADITSEVSDTKDFIRKYYNLVNCMQDNNCSNELKNELNDLLGRRKILNSNSEIKIHLGKFDLYFESIQFDELAFASFMKKIGNNLTLESNKDLVDLIKKVFFKISVIPGSRLNGISSSLMKKNNIKIFLQPVFVNRDETLNFSLGMARRLSDNSSTIFVSFVDNYLSLVLKHEARHVLSFIDLNNGKVNPINALYYYTANAAFVKRTYDTVATFDEITNRTLDFVSGLLKIEQGGIDSTYVVVLKKEFEKLININNNFLALFKELNPQDQSILDRDGDDLFYLKSYPEIDASKRIVLRIDAFMDNYDNLIDSVGYLKSLLTSEYEKAIASNSELSAIYAKMIKDLNYPHRDGFLEAVNYFKNFKKDDGQFYLISKNLTFEESAKLNFSLDLLNKFSAFNRRNIYEINNAMIVLTNFNNLLEYLIKPLVSQLASDNKQASSSIRKLLRDFYMLNFKPLNKSDGCQIATTAKIGDIATSILRP